MAEAGSQNSGNNLLRDYGLTVGLLVVSGLLLWRSTLPQMDENRVLDEKRVELEQKIQRQQQRVDALEALDRAGSDPIVLERMNREYFGDLDFPADECLVDPDAPGGSSTIPQE